MKEHEPDNLSRSSHSVLFLNINLNSNFTEKLLVAASMFRLLPNQRS